MLTTTMRRTWAVVLANNPCCRNCCQQKPACSRQCRGAVDPERLRQTLDQASSFATLDRIVVSGYKEYESWWQRWSVADAGGRYLPQPVWAGTGPATLLATLLGDMCCPGATIALLPSAHPALDQRSLLHPVHAAATWLEQDPDAIILLGAAPNHPAQGGGWLLSQDDDGPAPFGPGLWPARQRGKPAPRRAPSRCRAWAYPHPSVIVYRAATMLRLIEVLKPDWWQALAERPVLTEEGLRAIYRRLPAFDLAADILQRCPAHLRLLPLPGPARTALCPGHDRHALQWQS